MAAGLSWGAAIGIFLGAFAVHTPKSCFNLFLFVCQSYFCFELLRKSYLQFQYYFVSIFGGCYIISILIVKHLNQPTWLTVRYEILCWIKPSLHLYFIAWYICLFPGGTSRWSCYFLASSEIWRDLDQNHFIVTEDNETKTCNKFASSSFQCSIQFFWNICSTTA